MDKVVRNQLPYYSYTPSPKPLLVSDCDSSPFSAENKQQIQNISKKINCEPKDLEALILAESGGNPAAYNPETKAYGLIQWMPRLYPKTVKKIKGLSISGQLPYVEEYLMEKKKIAGFADNEKLNGGQIYALVLMPNKAKSGIGYKKGSIEYKQNKDLDLDKDGVIEVHDDLERALDKYRQKIN